MNYNQFSAGAACLYCDDSDGSFHQGEILGKDKSSGDQFVWAFVYDRKVVFHFHPNNAVVDKDGAIVFFTYNREMPLKKVLAQRPDDGTASMFCYAANPDEMLRRLRAWDLIMP